MDADKIQVHQLMKYKNIVFRSVILAAIFTAYFYFINIPHTIGVKISFFDISAIIFMIFLSANLIFFVVSERKGDIKGRVVYFYVFLLIMAVHHFSIFNLWMPFFKPVKLVRFDIIIWIAVLLIFAYRSVGDTMLQKVKAVYGSFINGKTALIILLVSAFIFALAFDIQFKRSWTTTGDEPHYLIASHSLIHDGDLDLKNDYDNRVFEKFSKFDVSDRHITKVEGKERPFHAPALSIILTPFYETAGVMGVRLFINIIFCVFLIYLYRVLLLLTKNRNIAFWVTLAPAFSLPLVVYSNQIFPEIFGALLSTISLYYLLKYRDAAEEDIPLPHIFIYSSMLSLMPWLHMRFIVLLLPMYALPYIVLYKKSIKTMLLYNVPFVISGSALAVFNTIVYSNFLGPATSETLFSSNFFEGMFGLFFDREFGILIYSPFYALAFLGIYHMARSERKVLVILPAVYFLYFLVIATYHHWYTGWAPVGRYVILWLPALVISAAYALHRNFNVYKAVFFGIFLFYSICVSVNMMMFPSLNFNEWSANTNNYNLLLSAASNFRINFNNLFPAIRYWENDSLLLLVIWIAATAAILVLLERKRKKRKDKKHMKNRLPVMFSHYISMLLLFIVLTTLFSGTIKERALKAPLSDKDYTAFYYADENYKGVPYLIKNEDSIAYDWSVNKGKPIGNIKWYSVCWLRRVADSGIRIKSIKSVNPVDIRFDGKQVISYEGGNVLRNYENEYNKAGVLKIRTSVSTLNNEIYVKIQ